MSERTPKYNPANFSPDHLFRPATSSTHGELTYLAEQLSQALEGSNRVKDRLLLVGTELEMFFFDPGIDPYIAKQGSIRSNPNYSDEHLNKIFQLQCFGETIRRQRPREFLNTEKQGRIFLEFHTAPQEVSQYLKTTELFGDLLRKECKNLNVLPVLYSQHIHVSLRNNPLSTVSGLEGVGMCPDEDVTRSAFSRITPLMLLPEEWSERGYFPVDYKDDGVIPGSRRRNLDHPEFRMLSSEYAFDPVLNLVVSLRAMHAGCLDRSAVSPKTYYDSYIGSIWEMSNDTELMKFFGQSTLSKLAQVVRQYPAVSDRTITIDQVK